MKAEKLSTEIAALERQSSKAKNAVIKKVIAKKIDKLKTELESITSEQTANDKIKKAKTKVNAMDAKEFNAYIKDLAKNPDFSFLKSMTNSEIVRDMKRTAKPVGWRFRGRTNSKTPTKKDIKDKNNVYYEGRRNRSDVSRKIRLKDGGGVDEQGIDLFEDYEDIPQNLQNILDKYMQKFDDDFGNMDYNDMADMHDEVYEIGYTFESGLDNQPYDLRPIGTKGKSEVEEYKNGGGVGDKIVAPNGYVFSKVGSHRAEQKVKRMGVEYITLYSFGGSQGTAGASDIFISEKDYDKIKGIIGVSNSKKAIKGDNHIFSRGENKKVDSVFRSIEQKYAEGGGVQGVDLNDWDMPVIRTQFEDEEFEYAKGGGVTKIKEDDYFLTIEGYGRYPQLKRFRVRNINGNDVTIMYSTTKSYVTELWDKEDIDYLLEKGHIKKTNEKEYWKDKYENKNQYSKGGETGEPHRSKMNNMMKEGGKTDNYYKHKIIMTDKFNNVYDVALFRGKGDALIALDALDKAKKSDLFYQLKQN